MVFCCAGCCVLLCFGDGGLQIGINAHRSTTIDCARSQHSGQKACVSITPFIILLLFFSFLFLVKQQREVLCCTARNDATCSCQPFAASKQTRHTLTRQCIVPWPCRPTGSTSS
jgi:hypothetical protein